MSHFDVYAVCRNCFSVFGRLRLPVGVRVSSVPCPACGVKDLETKGPALEGAKLLQPSLV